MIILGHLIQLGHVLVLGLVLLLTSWHLWVLYAWFALVGVLYRLFGGCVLTMLANTCFASCGHTTHRNLYYWAYDWGGVAGCILVAIAVFMPYLIFG